MILGTIQKESLTNAPVKKEIKDLTAALPPGGSLLLDYPANQGLSQKDATIRDYQLLAECGFSLQSRIDDGSGKIVLVAEKIVIPRLRDDLTPKYDMVYVQCPAGNKTGGTELAHQLVYRILSLGGNATVAYYGDVETMTVPAFLPYVAGHICKAEDIVDESRNAVVVPEVHFYSLIDYKKATRMHWWMSVDNFFEAANVNSLDRETALSLAAQADLHLYQSHYAFSFLKSRGVPEDRIRPLSDYLNRIYTQDPDTVDDVSVKRKDRLLYNPAKGAEFTKKLLRELPSSIEACAITNMSNEEVFSLMHESKIYTDFGEHPGKDRIPREAAMCGLIVVTGRKGAAAFHEDIFIPEEYRIDEATTPISDIINLLESCVHDYEVRCHDFDAYRQKISREEATFEQDVISLFFHD